MRRKAEVGGCHIVYQIQLCNCVMDAAHREMRRVAGWTREKILVFNSLESLRSI